MAGAARSTLWERPRRRVFDLLKLEAEGEGEGDDDDDDDADDECLGTLALLVRWLEEDDDEDERGGG